MEVFNLLKFWRYAGDDRNNGSGCADVDLTHRHSSFRTTTTTTTNDERNQLLETDDETDEEDSFFDLVFAAPNCANKEEDNSKAVDINSFDSDKDNYNTMSKGDREIRSNFIESPIDVFYRRKYSPVASNSILNSNSKPQSPISLLRSPPKFRVFMLGFKKSKSDKTERAGASMAKSSPERQSKRFTVKWKEEESEFPIASLFTRDNSLRSKLQKEKSEDASMVKSSQPLNKDPVHKYLNLIRPLYVRASQRYSDKTRFSDQHSTVSPFSSPATVPVFLPRKQAEEKQGSRAAVLRGVCKNLVKSRSASSAVGNTPSPVAIRRDDSAMLQQDVQSAIQHCKRSYSSSSQECCQLSRSASDSSHEKSAKATIISTEEEKRFSI